MDAVVLAAGKGKRFVAEGQETPKPLVPLCGRPMIDRLVDILSNTVDGTIVVAVNKGSGEVERHMEELQQRYPRLKTLTVDSKNSFDTLAVASRVTTGKFIACTCDTVFSPQEFALYVKRYASMSPDELLMGVTGYVDDDRPLYIRIADTGEIVDFRYGGEPFSGDVTVSAGVYGLTGEAVSWTCAAGHEPATLNEFQRKLASGNRYKLFPFELGKVFDVDNGRVLAAAQEYLQNNGVR